MDRAARMTTRADGRRPDHLRDVRITRPRPDQLRDGRVTAEGRGHAEGSVLIEFGATRVRCAASVTEGVPRWRKGSGLGWVTSEYAMLPRATHTRSAREAIKG